MIFYLGTHHDNWLARAGVPLFVSRRRLAPRKKLPRAVARWALDSGGFTELSMFGQWTVPVNDYCRDVQRFSDEIGWMDFAAPQDWMCEPSMLKKTGKTVQEHQTLTLANYEDLLSRAPHLPWMPVLQGWVIDDYHRHADHYVARGHRLQRAGLGSVCRRQGTDEIGRIASSLAASGIALHGFGVKSAGIKKYGNWLVSADSMAWSFTARRRRAPQFPSCTHKNCANCLAFALQWRKDLLCGAA